MIYKYESGVGGNYMGSPKLPPGVGKAIVIATALALLTQIEGCPDMLYRMFTREDWEGYLENQNDYLITIPDN